MLCPTPVECDCKRSLKVHFYQVCVTFLFQELVQAANLPWGKSPFERIVFTFS